MNQTQKRYAVRTVAPDFIPLIIKNSAYFSCDRAYSAISRPSDLIFEWPIYVTNCLFNASPALKVVVLWRSFELRRKRPVRTRMRGVVEAGGEKPPAIRLGFISQLGNDQINVCTGESEAGLHLTQGVKEIKECDCVHASVMHHCRKYLGTKLTNS